MQKLVLSCDWGTSSFRLRLVNTESRQTINEIVSDAGNAVVYKKWKEEQCPDRRMFYLHYLKDAIEKLSRRTGLDLADPVIIISGMASSSIGLRELGYADLPFSLDGHNAHTEWIGGQPVLANEILLVSGVQHAGDVMRGEETQLVGIRELNDVAGDQDALYILPGTHSKHITVRDNCIVDFQTYMTGEVFDILIRYSILGDTVSAPADQGLGSGEKDAFLAGISKGFTLSLLNGLFSVRINQLKKYFSHGQNYFYLSGLLIGEELKQARAKNNQQIILCSGSKTEFLYRLALEHAGLSAGFISVSPELVDRAAAAGQLKIWKNLQSKIVL